MVYPSNGVSAAVQRSAAHTDATGEPLGPPESRRLIEWSDHATIDSALVQLVLDGRLIVRWPDELGQPTFATADAEAEN